MNRTAWTYFAAQRWAQKALRDSSVDPAAPQFLLEQRHNWDTTHLLLHNRDLMPADEQEWFEEAVQQLLKDVPAQYIVGKTTFYGRPFRVTRDVLIPEPETAELVDWVLATVKDTAPLKVLDLGTGSGVIGITLALEVARENADRLGAKVRTVTSDLFDQLAGARFDLIVTNPPYIDPAAKDKMDRAVLEYEPPLALFADEHGLGFYHRLFTQVGAHLTADGQVFAETGYDQEDSIQELLKRCDKNATITVRHDVADKMRMMHAWDFSGAGGN